MIKIPGIAEEMTTQGVRIIHHTDFIFTNLEKSKGLTVAGAVDSNEDAPTKEGFNFAYEVRKGSDTDRIALEKGPGDAQEYYDNLSGWFSSKAQETEQLEINVPTHIIARTPTLKAEKDEMYQLAVFVGTP